MERFGAEPYEDLLYCVKVAKIVESNDGITRDRISELLKMKQDENKSADVAAFKLLKHLGWIEKKQDDKYFWSKISNHSSKLLWESKDVKTEKTSDSNLQFACWALFASLRHTLPLSQVISILIKKNVWIVNDKDNDPFFVSLRCKFASQSIQGVELYQSRFTKFQALFRNLNYLGLTRPLQRIQDQYSIHVELPSDVTFFLLENLIFPSEENASIQTFLEVLQDTFGIISDISEIPKVLGNSIFELKTRQRLSTSAESSETHSFRISNPRNYREQDHHLSHVRDYG